MPKEQEINDIGITPTEVSVIDMWHPFSGKWVHIRQAVENEKRKYYTDGKREDI